MYSKPKIDIIIPSKTPISVETLKKHPFPLEQIITVIPDTYPKSKNPRGSHTILSSPMGRAKQLNAGITHSTADIIICLHADTKLPQNAIQLIQECFSAHPNTQAGAFSLKFDTPHPLLNIIAKLTTLRSKLTRIPYGDQALFFKKSILEKTNGFPDLPLLEDVLLMKQLKKMGVKIKILPQNATTSAERYLKNGIVKQSLKNRLIILASMLGISPKTLKKFYT